MATLQTADFAPAKSLFKRTLELKIPLSMSTQVHRLIMLISIVPSPGSTGNTSALRSPRGEFTYFEEHAKRWRDCRHGDTLTGIVVYYPEYILCLMECSAETLSLAMKDVLRDISSEHLCAAAKILSYGSSISCRLFKDWSSRSMPRMQTNVQDDLSTESVAHNLPMLNEAILKFSVALTKFPKVDLAVHVDRLRHTLSHLLIPKEHFDYLIKQDEITPVEGFLQRYHSRHELPDDNESIWPIPAPFRPPLKH